MTTPAPTPKKFPIVPVVLGVVAIALIAVVVLTFDSGGSSDQLGSPDVTGEVLPRFPEGTADPAVGMAIPEVVGADFDGTPVSITNDGNAKIIIFLAHWCPHCQRELPVVSDWLQDDPLLEGVDIFAIATGISSTRENYPPEPWFEREGWTGPIIVDDAVSTIGGSFGLSAYPFWVFVDGDGNVLARVTGGVAPDDLDNAVAALQSTVGS